MLIRCDTSEAIEFFVLYNTILYGTIMNGAMCARVRACVCVCICACVRGCAYAYPLCPRSCLSNHYFFLPYYFFFLFSSPFHFFHTSSNWFSSLRDLGWYANALKRNKKTHGCSCWLLTFNERVPRESPKQFSVGKMTIGALLFLFFTFFLFRTNRFLVRTRVETCTRHCVRWWTFFFFFCFFGWFDLYERNELWYRKLI